MNIDAPINEFHPNVIPEPNSGCWIWVGPGKIYGSTRFKYGHSLAHRVSYHEHKGAIPEGLDLDHLCKNKVCVNPNHLEPVTRSVNMLRTHGDHCLKGHLLCEGNLVKLTGKRRNMRRCRICHNDLMKKYRSTAKYE
jgi:hypothetical protein